MKTFGIVFFILGLALTLCNSKPREKIAWEIAKDERQISIVEISRKYKNSISIDSLGYTMNWTCQIQEFFNLHESIIIDKFEINDVIRSDSNDILKIEVDKSQSFFIEVVCTKIQMNRLYPELLARKQHSDDSKKIFLVTRIKEVMRPEFRITPMVEYIGTYDEWPYLAVEASNAFILRGELIDFELR